MRLLGFHDRDRLKPYHNTDTAYFAEAAERRREGSQAALEALVGAMLRKDKVGFATLTLRVRRATRSNLAPHKPPPPSLAATRAAARPAASSA